MTTEIKAKVRQWTASYQSPLVEMSLAEMLSADYEKVQFDEIYIGHYEINASVCTTDNIAIIAQYLLKPYIEGTLKYPLGAYISALSDNVFVSNVDFDFDELKVVQKIKADGGVVDYNKLNTVTLKTLINWVDHNLVSYYEADEKPALLQKYLDYRCNHFIADMRSKIGPLQVNYIADLYASSNAISVFEHDQSVLESHVIVQTFTSRCRYYSALFHINREEKDEYYDLFKDLPVTIYSI